MKHFIQKYKLALVLVVLSLVLYGISMFCAGQSHFNIFCGFGDSACPPYDANDGTFFLLFLVFLGLSALSALSALIAAFIKTSRKLPFAIIVLIPVIIWLINQYINGRPY